MTEVEIEDDSVLTRLAQIINGLQQDSKSRPGKTTSCLADAERFTGEYSLQFQK